jgi:Flp pilus assembly pilin Flp
MIGKFTQTVGRFLGDEDGAVTVDWVVLTAAVVGLGLVIGPTIGQNTVGLSEDIAADVDEVRIYQYSQSETPTP